MGETNNLVGAHILAFPFPIPGHVNPMIQLAKRLSSKGVKITLVVASNEQSEPYTVDYSISVRTIPNGFTEKDHRLAVVNDVVHFSESTIRSLSQFIQREMLSENPPKAIIFDAYMSWTLDIAQEFGLKGFAYFTQPWLVNLIYHYVNEGSYEVLYSKPDHPTLSSFPSMPLLRQNDMPSFASQLRHYPYLSNVMFDQFSNVLRADSILCNTFDQLEEKVMKMIAEKKWRVKNIGPVVPSMYMDKRLPEDKDYGVGNYNRKPDDGAMEWLESKARRSVVYVAFGTIADLEEKQMKAIALGLQQSGFPFLWSVREIEQRKLSTDFLEEIKEKKTGLIARWCPQLEVLAHESVGCFLTHCGWNSTLEALSLGVPLVGMPVWVDQPTNAKFIEDVWKVGNRVKADKDGFVPKEEVARCVKEIMDGEKGKEIRVNMEKWKELAIEAVSKEGSSDQNIDDLVAMFA